MSKLSSYQKLKARNKELQDRLNNIESILDKELTSKDLASHFASAIRTLSYITTTGPDKQYIIDGFISKISPQKSTKNTWFSKIINNFTKYLYGRKR